MTTEVRLVLDASNFARVSDTKSDLTRFFAVIADIAEALDGRKHHLYIIWDSDYMRFFGPSSRRKLESWNPKSKFLNAEQEIAQPGTKADVVVLNWAQQRPGSIVLSSDVYKEYDEHKHWLLQPGRFVCGTYTQHDESWLLMERQIYPDGPGRITRDLRKLSDLLDDTFPTVRSIARKSRIQIQVLTKLMEESGGIKSETMILTEDESSTARSFADVVARKPFMLANLAQEAGKSIVEMREWTDALKLEIELVGENVFMDVVGEELLMNAIQSNHSDISVYRALVFARNRDLHSLKKLSRTKIVQHSLVAKSLTECWIKSLECISKFNSSLLLDVHPEFRLEIFEYLLGENLIDVDESIPVEIFKDATSETGLLVECSRVLSLKKWKNLINVIDLAETLVVEKGELSLHIRDHVFMTSLLTNMSQLEFVRALKIPKSQFKSVSDRIERTLPKSIVPDVLRYESGQIEVLFADSVVASEDAVNPLLTDFLKRAGISWIDPQHLRGWKPTDSEVETMKAGDLSPLLSIRKVVRETIRNISILRENGDEIVVLGLLCAASAEISRLEDLMGDIPKKMSHI
jgi:hypothetical protein